MSTVPKTETDMIMMEDPEKDVDDVMLLFIDMLLLLAHLFVVMLWVWMEVVI